MNLPSYFTVKGEENVGSLRTKQEMNERVGDKTMENRRKSNFILHFFEGVLSVMMALDVPCKKGNTYPVTFDNFIMLSLTHCC